MILTPERFFLDGGRVEVALRVRTERFIKGAPNIPASRPVSVSEITFKNQEAIVAVFSYLNPENVRLRKTRPYIKYECFDPMGLKLPAYISESEKTEQVDESGDTYIVKYVCRRRLDWKIAIV